jgi:hypothetical protein
LPKNVKRFSKNTEVGSEGYETVKCDDISSYMIVISELVFDYSCMRMHGGRRYGVEIKFTDAPAVTKSMRIALQDLQLDRLWIVAPVESRYELAEKVEVCPPS